MRKIFQTIIIISVLAFNAAIVFGQEKEITESEYSAITDKAAAFLEKRTYRESSTSETFADRELKQLTETSKSIYEFVPPNRIRSVYEDEDGKTERIEIGSRIYVRKNNGKWKRDNEINNTILGRSNVSKSEYSYKFLEKTTFNGKSASVYSYTRTEYDLNQNINDVYMRIFWVDSEGKYLKEVSEFTNFKSNYFNRYTSNYEYDLKIRIVAPIISTKKN